MHPTNQSAYLYSPLIVYHVEAGDVTQFCQILQDTWLVKHKGCCATASISVTEGDIVSALVLSHIAARKRALVDWGSYSYRIRNNRYRVQLTVRG